MKKILVILTLAVLFLIGCESPTSVTNNELVEVLQSSYKKVSSNDTVGVFVNYCSDTKYSEIRISFYFQNYTIINYLPKRNSGSYCFFKPFLIEELPLIIDVKVFGVRYE
jgi:hypothetical protein